MPISGIEAALALIAAIFALFLVLSAAVEAILEALRKPLEFIGIPVMKPAMTIDEAIALATATAKEFPSKLDGEIAIKLSALKMVTENSVASVQELSTSVEQVVTAFSNTQPGMPPSFALQTRVDAMAALVKAKLDENEKRKVFLLRLLAAVIGCGVAYWVNLDVIKLVQTMELPAKPGQGWYALSFGHILAGLAAAGGSSFWHDKLDKVRSLKTLSAQIATKAT
jgi:hypothetical protein